MKGLKHAIHNTDNRRTWSEVSAVLQSDETSSSWWSNAREAEKISVLGTARKITSLTAETIQIAWTSHADHAERNHIKKDKPIKTSQSERWEQLQLTHDQNIYPGQNSLQNIKRTSSQIALRQLLTRTIWKQIHKLDNLELFEESYALTQEWREWILDPQINNNF